MIMNFVSLKDREEKEKISVFSHVGETEHYVVFDPQKGFTYARGDSGKEWDIENNPDPNPEDPTTPQNLRWGDWWLEIDRDNNFLYISKQWEEEDFNEINYIYVYQLKLNLLNGHYKVIKFYQREGGRKEFRKPFKGKWIITKGGRFHLFGDNPLESTVSFREAKYFHFLNKNHLKKIVRLDPNRIYTDLFNCHNGSIEAWSTIMSDGNIEEVSYQNLADPDYSECCYKSEREEKVSGATWAVAYAGQLYSGYKMTLYTLADPFSLDLTKWVKYYENKI